MNITKNIIIALLLATPVLQGMEPEVSPILNRASSVPDVTFQSQKTEDGWTLVVRNSDDMLGYIKYADCGNKKWFINHFMIFDEYRKKGIGSLLFTEAITRIKENDPHEIQWMATNIDFISSRQSVDDVAAIYRALCGKIQSILPGSLYQERCATGVFMTYRVSKGAGQ